MKIGVRAHDYGRWSVEKYAKLLHEEGYETVQLAVPKCFEGVNGYEDITPKLIEEIREEFTRQQVEITVFSCYMDLANPDADVRAKAVDTFRNCLEYAKMAGAYMVGTETSYEQLGSLEKRIRLPYVLDCLKRMTEEAERLDMRIGLEPVATHPLENMDLAVEVLDMLGSDKVNLIFDPVNVLPRPAQTNQEAYWKHCLKLAGDRIKAIHLKDCTVDEAGVRHDCALGAGCMEYGTIREWVQSHEEIAVIRDELNLVNAERDMAFIKAWKKG